MRVLVTCQPHLGHVIPMLPLALALRDAGHSILFATGSEVLPVLSDVGLLSAAVGPSRSDRRAIVESAVSGIPVERSALWERTVTVVNPTLADALVNDLLSLADDWGAEVVLHDFTELAGEVVAGLLDIPAVTVALGLWWPSVVRRRESVAVQRLWDSWGVGDRRAARCASRTLVDLWPAALQDEDVVGSPNRHAIRPGGWELSTVPHDLLKRLDSLVATGRRLVYVTFGTVFASEHELHRVLNSIDSDDCAVACSTGPRLDPRRLAEAFPRALLERWLPQHEVMRRSDLVICHGGAGTIAGCVLAGRPALVLPFGSDQFAVGERIQRLGAGLTLDPLATSTPAVQAAVQTLLTQAAFAEAAGRLSTQVRQLPQATAVVRIVEASVVGGRTG